MASLGNLLVTGAARFVNVIKGTVQKAQNGVFYGTCATAAATAAKVVTLVDGDNFELKPGVMIAVKFTVANTASNVTLNVNGTGAKSIWAYNRVETGATAAICGGWANYYFYYVYDGTNWVFLNSSNNVNNNSDTYTSAYCGTGADIAAKAAACSYFTLKANSYLHINIRYSNTAAGALTMNVNGTGAKPIYINGTVSSSSNHTLPAGSYIAFYNGTYWDFNTNGSLPGTLSIANGGTNATTAADARTNLGLGAAATHGVETTLANDSKLPTGAAVTAAINNATDFGTVGSNQNPVYFNDGDPEPIAFTFGVDDDQNVQVAWDGDAPDIVIPTNTALAIDSGGTGATTAAGARTNLGLGGAALKEVVSAVQDDDNLVTNGAVKRYVDGLVDGTVTSHDISGSVLSFEATNAQPVKSMVLNLEPHQNLNGYSHSWIGGAGKNLFKYVNPSVTSPGTVVSYDDNRIHIHTDGSQKWMGSFNDSSMDLPAGTYYLKFKVAAGATLSSYSKFGARSRSSNVIITMRDITAANASYSLTINATEPFYLSYLANSTNTGSEYATDLTIYDIMVSTTDSAFEPYSNICPISGYDAVNVVRTGKNLIDLDAFTVGGIGNNGLPDSNSERMVDTKPIIIDDSLSYTISAQYAESAYDLRIIYSVFNYDTLVRRIANVSIKNTSATLNVSGGNKLYICLYCDQSHAIVKSSVSELQLEIGTTKTTYEPYSGTTYPISLSSAGTVYGGSLDVTNGLLTVDKGYKTVGDITWYYDSNYTRFYGSISDIIIGIGTRCTSFICSAYQSIDDGRALGSVPDGSIYGAGSTTNVYIKDTRYTASATFKSEMSDVQIVYPLATPITYRLTPIEVTTLLGQNTIWIDASGTINLTYEDVVSSIKYAEVGELGTAAVRNANNKVVPDDTLPTGKAITEYTPSHAQNGIYYGTCATAAGTAAKVIELVDPTGFELKPGVMIAVAFEASNTADNETFNVEGTGAIGISYIKGTRYTGHTNTITGHLSYIMYYIYDGTYWCFVNNSSNYANNSNTVPAAQCETAAATAAKAATCTNHTLTANTYLHFNIRYSNTVKGAITMNVDSSGAKPIYINGGASSSSNYALPAGTYIAFYNGTNWYFNTNGGIPFQMGGGDTWNTTAAASSDTPEDIILREIAAIANKPDGIYTNSLSWSDHVNGYSISIAKEHYALSTDIAYHGSFIQRGSDNTTCIEYPFTSNGTWVNLNKEYDNKYVYAPNKLSYSGDEDATFAAAVYAYAKADSSFGSMFTVSRSGVHYLAIVQYSSATYGAVILINYGTIIVWALVNGTWTRYTLNKTQG